MAADEMVLRQFEARFGEAPEVLVRAPGRVNLIGEHTDYNDGFVLPAAIDRELWVALTPSGDEHVEASSVAFDEPVAFRLDELGGDERLQGWGAYVQGVAWALAETGRALGGFRAAVASDIPVGAGLSSSAAMELAFARAFQSVSGWPWEPLEMAHVGQRVENDWVGVSSGIMDQVASACGRDDHALLLDCRTLEITAVPLPEQLALVVLDTGTRRELLGSAYGDRRRECEAAAAQLGVAALRDVAAAELEARATELDPVLLRRARHVVSEGERTRAAAAALREGDAERLGALLDASHASLREDFEVSSDAFEAIVAAARGIDGCYGARLTGGGFAGCALALVHTARVAAFTAELPRRYRAATGKDATVHVCKAVDGASAIDPRGGREILAPTPSA